MREYDVAIVGGGVVGAAVAHELSHYRLNVVLLEKEEDLSFGVSKANSGIIHPGTQNPADSLKGRLCVEGNRLVREMSADLDLDFKEVGELVVAFDDSEVGRLWQLKQEGEALGVPGLEIVSREWLRDNEPNLNPDAVAALHAPTAGIISPYRFVFALSESAQLNGVEVLTRTRVEWIERISPAGPGEGARFVLAGAAGEFAARYVVNCGGLHADDIAAMVGACTFHIRPRKGEEYILDKKRRYLTRHLLFPVPTPESKGILVTRTSDGNPMIGPTAYEVDDREDLSTTDDGLRQVLAVAQRLVPAIDPRDIIAYFAGLRPAAGDDFVIRSESQAPGFVNVAGIQSPGLTAAPAIARHVAGLLSQTGMPLVPKDAPRRQNRRSVHLFSMPLGDARRLVEHDPECGDIVCRCETVSLREVKQAIEAGATTLDGVKFRTRAGAGRCHGSFCTCRIMRLLADETGRPVTAVSKRGAGSELVVEDRADG
ncbi:MAG: NAD(P)/FAD-dependent oxidoreductase [Dehalococcoidia bacterium]|jgi:glycerol-3-phosphate dehydrogenase|nr:NAD(P)/FAD-dependent oxidoreductase [Dehalococcoidia bacterium]